MDISSIKLSCRELLPPICPALTNSLVPELDVVETFTDKEPNEIRSNEYTARVQTHQILKKYWSVVTCVKRNYSLGYDQINTQPEFRHIKY